MIIPMNAGMRPHILSTMLLGLALGGCAQLPGEPPKVEPMPPKTSTGDAPPKSSAVEASPKVEAAGQSHTAQAAPALALAAPASPLIRPGECWVQAVIQPRPQSKPLEIVVRDAVNDIEVTPPKLERTTKEIEVREGGVTYRITPPVYKPVTEKVLIRPELRRSVVEPAVFEERIVEIEVEGGRTVLERCKLPTARAAAGVAVQPLCAREIPPRKEKVKRQVLVKPETTREEVIQAVYKTITRWVLEKPAQAIPVEIPPRTTRLTVQEIAAPEQIEEKTLPPKVRELLATYYEGQPQLAFRQAVCDDDLSPELVAGVQRALRTAGFDPGQVDGKLGRQTLQALLAYQRQNGLAVGALTYETLESLGVGLPK